MIPTASSFHCLDSQNYPTGKYWTGWSGCSNLRTFCNDENRNLYQAIRYMECRYDPDNQDQLAPAQPTVGDPDTNHDVDHEWTESEVSNESDSIACDPRVHRRQQLAKENNEVNYKDDPEYGASKAVISKERGGWGISAPYMYIVIQNIIYFTIF